MSRVRFRLRSILVAVVVLAVGTAALREAGEYWDSALFTATLAALAAAALGAVHRGGPARAYWLGFAVCGGVYLAATLVPAVSSRLLTTKALTYAESQRPGRTAAWTVSFANPPGGSSASAIAFSPDGRLIGGPVNSTVRIWSASTGQILFGPGGLAEHFVGVGHSLFALLAAAAGGRLSRALARPCPGEAARGEPSPDPAP